MSRFARRHLRRPPASALLLAREGLRLVLEEAPAPVARQMHALVSAAVAFTRRARPAVEPWPADAPPWTAPAAELAPALEAGDAGAIAEAAADLSRAADTHGARMTAGVLAEVAALLERENAEAALRVATLARDRGDHLTTEWWGHRTAELARTAEKWSTAVKGCARAADSLQQRGEYEQAIRMRKRELAMATRSGSQDLISRATHSMFGTYVMAERFTDADVWAIRATHLYPPDHPRLPALANDIARMCIQRGNADQALPTLRFLATLDFAPEDRIELGRNLAYAGTQTRSKADYEFGISEVLSALDALHYGGPAAGALAEIAECAIQRGDITSGRLWASEAASLARVRRDAETYERAERVLSLVGRINYRRP